MNIQIINGPNLNLTGKREKNIYGNISFDIYIDELKKKYPDFQIDYYQSNIEGEIINKIHETGFTFDGILLNPGAYTHTSIAIADAVAAITCPVVEVHLSNILAREPERKTSLISNNCIGSICGFGLDSYRLGIESLIHFKKQ